MDSCPYELRYLPLFYKDLEEKILYISETFHNPKAAKDLLDAVEKAILERQPFAESFEIYPSEKNRRNNYYRIYVKNYVIFYVVIEDDNTRKIMEVRRFLYHKQYCKEFL